jgi:hypothetical protein
VNRSIELIIEGKGDSGSEHQQMTPRIVTLDSPTR